MTVAERVQHVRERIASAARSAGRDPSEVHLIAVCKRQPFDRVLAAYEAGLRDFGENTAQGLRAHADSFAAAGCRDVRWHFIGTLQRNKVNPVLRSGACIHSIDRPNLAEAVAQRAEEDVDVLVEVNVSGEASKSGAPPDAAVALAQQVAALPRLRLRGLMTVPPADVDPTPYFNRLRQLACELPPESRELSMGMSDDFEIAIACGAHWVRVGTALFGAREERTPSVF